VTFAATFQPYYAAISSYNDPSSPSQTQTLTLASSFALYGLFISTLSLIFLINSLRNNIIFVIIFIGATLVFLLAAAAFLTTAKGMKIGAMLLVWYWWLFLCRGYYVGGLGFAEFGKLAGEGFEYVD
jgi:hypothetical protein